MRTVQLDEGLYRTVGDNGVTVLSEALPRVRSVATGIWVRTASVHENARTMGVSHLLEHMVFKGTARRTAKEIATELEVRGGSLDAFTSRDHTSYQARVMDEDLPRALDVLTDMVREPALREPDLELERKVVLEEISTVEDTPDDLIFDLHYKALWPDNPYGFPILGTRESVGGLGTADLRTLHQRAYHPRHVVIAAVGNVEHEVLLKLLTRCGWFTFDPGPEPRDVNAKTAVQGATQRFERPSAQTHILIGSDTVPYSDRRRFPLMLVNTVLGSGMSSRLFQRVREELGIAYSVYSFQSFYRAAGVHGVYVGTSPERAAEANEVVLEQLAELAAEGIDDVTLGQAKQQLKGQIMLALESPLARMNRLAALTLFGESYQRLDELLVAVDAVSTEDILEVTGAFYDPARQTAVWLGPS